MRRPIISIAITVPLILGTVMSFLSPTEDNFVHISVLHPEYSHVDSCYIDARGFPVPLWASNDPDISGYGENKEAILWSRAFSNTLLWTLPFGVLELPALLVILVVCVARRSRIVEWIAARQSDPLGWSAWVTATKLHLFLWIIVHVAVVAFGLLMIMNSDRMVDTRVITLAIVGYPCMYLWAAYPLLRTMDRKKRAYTPRCEEGTRE
jgi:hypothetical protein